MTRALRLLLVTVASGSLGLIILLNFALCDPAAGHTGSCLSTPEKSIRKLFLPEVENRISVVPIPDEVRFEELSKGLRKQRWTLIDCRNASELEDPGKIPGSYNVPLHEATSAFKLTEEDFYKRYGFKKPDPRDSNVAVSCRSGKRAEEFIDKLRPLGYDNFKLYKGSFLDWMDHGGEITSSKKAERSVQ